MGFGLLFVFIVMIIFTLVSCWKEFNNPSGPWYKGGCGIVGLVLAWVAGVAFIVLSILAKYAIIDGNSLSMTISGALLLFASLAATVARCRDRGE